MHVACACTKGLSRLCPPDIVDMADMAGIGTVGTLPV